MPWVIWVVAAIAYALAIINRSSLSALGPAAQEHFHIDATTLATFGVIQLVVYAAMQIPVGTLLDRFGPTALILSGAVLMALGQIAMATVSEVWLAILARVLVGAGDACTFISVMRLLPEWFSIRQLPTISQLTGLTGQIGQLLAVAPLGLLVQASSWSTAFLSVAGLGLFIAILVALVVRDSPGAGTAVERMTGRIGRTSKHARSLAADPTTSALLMAPPATEMLPVVGDPRIRALGFWTRARRLLSFPGVRLAYWIHFVAPFSGTAFLLLWGTPFLTGGLGLTTEQAAGLLSITIVSGITAGLLLGPISSRFLERRVWIALSVTCAVMCTWLLVLLWPGTPPMWLIITLLIIMPIGGPSSMISFEVARSHTPRSFAGFGTGLVNTGGFTSALLVMLLIGWVLDLQGAGSPATYSLEAFRWAFAVQIPFWLLGLTMMLVEERRTLRWMRHHGRRLR